MNRLILTCTLALTAAACGDNHHLPGLFYTDPTGGALRLVTGTQVRTNGPATTMVLEFVVGDAAVTGYSTGFDLPLDATKVTLGAFRPGHTLDPGSAPVAADAVLASRGPLAGMLVIGQSQKAGGTGAVVADTALPPGAVLYTVELDLVEPATPGVVFDGTAQGFALPSGGLRNKVGMTVVDPGQVAIGKLEVRNL